MENSDRDASTRRGTAVAGLSVIGAFLAGAGSLFGGLIATASGDFVGGGAYGIAAALAFGLLANAVYRR